MQNNDTMKEKKDLFVLIQHIRKEKSSWQKAAAWHGLPDVQSEPSTQEETFGQWLTSILDRKTKPTAIKEYNDTYALIQEFEPARQWVRESIQAEPKGIWAMLDAMGPMMPYETIEMLADYLVTHPMAKSHIVTAMKRPVPGCPELNPEGLDRIAEVLDKPWNEQLWLFLDDSIPHDRTDIWITFDREQAGIDEYGTVCGVRESTTSATDLLYSDRLSLWEISEAGMARMLPYIPLLRACYHPYEWNLSVNGITEKEQAKLAQLIDKGSCKGTVKDIAKELNPGTIIIPATFSVTVGGTRHAVNGFLYTEDDRPEYDDEEY